MVKVKICGITCLDDALWAAGCGADALGFIFWDKSPRHITPEAASIIIKELPPFTAAVGVFVNSSPSDIIGVIKETGISAVQLHGDEGPEVCDEVAGAGVKVIKVFRVRAGQGVHGIAGYNVSAYLLDTYREGLPGGTGETFDWAAASAVKKSGNVILSGGLRPDNVGEAVRTVRPYAVDVSSGVEFMPGRKDKRKVYRFIESARGAFIKEGKGEFENGKIAG